MEQQLTNEEVFFTINGEEECNTELALSILLREDVLFANSRRYYCPFAKENPQPETVVLFVAADEPEEITVNEVPALFKLWQARGELGIAEWVQQKQVTHLTDDPTPST